MNAFDYRFEEWRPVHVAGYETVYSVSSFGRLRREARGMRHNTRPGGRVWKPATIINGVVKNGYRRFLLCRDGERKWFAAHRLVIGAFVGASDLVCCHNNNDPLDNRLSNLRYATQKDNMRQAAEEGRMQACNGKRTKSAKLSSSDVGEILFRLSRGDQQKTISADFRISQATLSSLKHGKSWRLHPARLEMKNDRQ